MLYWAAAYARGVKPAYDQLETRRDGHFAEGGGWYAAETFVTAKPVRAWGSWCGSDDNHGALRIGPFRASNSLRIAVAGYPGKPGVELYVEKVASRARLPITTPDVGERWRIVDIAVPADWRGAQITLGAVDRAKGHGGWIALTEPIVGGPGGTLTLLETLAAWAINGVLLGVLWLAAVRLLSKHVPAAWLALLAAGLVAFAGYLTFWAYFGHATLGRIVSMALMGAAAVSWWRSRGEDVPREAAEVARLAALIGTFYVALLQLFPGPAPFYDVAANRFRENLPADNSIPHIIASRLYEGTSPRNPIGDWHSSDRPPLQSGWQLLTWPMTAALDISPDAASGTSAVWLQLTWIGAAYGLFRALGLSSPRSSAWIAVMATSGFFALQTLFTWPKLAAGALGCGTFGLWVLPRPEERSRMVLLAGAALAALAWLLHGGVAFSFLVLAPWVAWRALRGEWRVWTEAAWLVAVLVAPWAAYQQWYDPPGNRLLKWHFAGQISPDPRGTWETIRANYARLTWEQVREHKLVNFAYQVHGRHTAVADFSTLRAPERRNVEFFHLGRALTWWLGGLAAGPVALFLYWRRKKRAAVPAPTRVHVAVWLWPALTIPVWCVLLFERGGAVLHQSSYAMVICAFVALSSAFDALNRWSLVPLTLLQAVSFGTTWAVGSTEVNGTPHPFALAIVIVAGGALAASVLRAVWTGDRQDMQPVPARNALHGSSPSPPGPEPGERTRAITTARGCLILSAVLWFSISASPGLAADAGRRPAGHWAGQLALPTGPLDIRVKLDTTDGIAWQGTIDIPAQGVRGFQLKVTVAGSRVRYSMPGVPGHPTYTGTLSDDGETITGDYTQGGATFPFSLQRTTASAAAAGPAIPAGVPGEGLQGHWLGALKPTPNLTLRLALDVGSLEPTQFEATLISIDQRNSRMAASSVTVQDGVVRVEFRQPVATFEGRLNGDGAELAGTWTQQNRRTPLTFQRQTRSAAPSRPQEPARPYPYSEHEVRVETSLGGVTLAGTLTIPRGPGPHPAAVLITGSGPQDRDQQVAGHRTFLVLADHLTRAGIAVLRCDDRGTGKSQGKFESAIQSDFVADTLATAAWLRARPEVDPRRVGLIGHSEGGMVAPRVAAKSPEIAFLVLLAAPGLPMEHIMIRQGRDIALAMGMNREFVDRNEATQREVLRILRSDLPAPAAIAAVRKTIESQYAGMSEEQRTALGLSKSGATDPQLKFAESPWLRDALRIDPREALRSVKCPVLALTGAKDLQVAAEENLSAIGAALAAGGNTRFTTKELPGLNHLFQTCRNGAPYEYALIEETFSPLALQEIAGWILGIPATAN